MSNYDDNMITFLEGYLFASEGESPSKAIEMQEKRGQQAVVRNQRLPKKVNDHSIPDDIRWNGVKDSMEYEERREIVTQNNINYTRQQYEKMGITVIDEYDDLFWNVKLPEGWEIKATDHSMWNNLFDDKGRLRADFFYKAAFYDRDAFTNFSTRFHLDVSHIAPADSDYEIWSASDFQGTIKDQEEIIFCTECTPATGNVLVDSNIKDSLLKQLEEFMKEHYPDYEDINSYWD